MKTGPKPKPDHLIKNKKFLVRCNLLTVVVSTLIAKRLGISRNEWIRRMIQQATEDAIDNGLINWDDINDAEREYTANKKGNGNDAEG